MRIVQWLLRSKPRFSSPSQLAWLFLCIACASFAFAGEAHADVISFLNPHGPIAAAQARHFVAINLLMLVVILPVLIGVPLIAWHYRRGNSKAFYAPKWCYSWPLEGLIWGGPLAIVAVMGLWLARGTTTLDPYVRIKTQDAPLKVDVIAYDWKWLFVYPRLHIASVGRLVFPEHRQLSIRLTSDSVMQSFLIPALGSQIYAMAAMQTRLHLISASTGQYLGENTQYDGRGFQHERFIARSTTPQGFRDWVTRVRATGVPLTAKTYDVIRGDNTAPQIRAALKADDMPPGAVFFNRVTPNLFKNVMMSFHGGPSTSTAIVGGAAAPPRKPIRPRKVPRPSVARGTSIAASETHRAVATE